MNMITRVTRFLIHTSTCARLKATMVAMARGSMPKASFMRCGVCVSVVDLACIRGHLCEALVLAHSFASIYLHSMIHASTLLPNFACLDPVLYICVYCAIYIYR